MCVEPVGDGIERTVEVAGDQLDELLADDLVGIQAMVPR